LRWFTRRADRCARGAVREVVVIPWRGFRCFTHNILPRIGWANCSPVVIPWRGLRCFTHEAVQLDRARGAFVCCNPLAGI